MAVNSCVKVNKEITDYIKFGNGKKTLVMIPGVGDGLKTVKGTAAPFSFMYRKLSNEFTVYAFSRPRDIKTGTTTRDMAGSLEEAKDFLQHILVFFRKRMIDETGVKKRKFRFVKIGEAHEYGGKSISN